MGACRVTSVPYYIPDAETSHSACNIRLSNGSVPSHLCPVLGAIYQTLKQATLPVIFGCPMGARRVTSVPYYIPDAETSHSACNIRLSNGSAPSHLCPLLYTRRYTMPDAETSPSACNIRLSNGSAPSHLCPLLYTRRWNKPLCL